MKRGRKNEESSERHRTRYRIKKGRLRTKKEQRRAERQGREEERSGNRGRKKENQEGRRKERWRLATALQQQSNTTCQLPR